MEAPQIINMAISLTTMQRRLLHNVNNYPYRIAYHGVEPGYRTSAPTTLVESNQSPEMVNIVNTGPSGW